MTPIEKAIFGTRPPIIETAETSPGVFTAEGGSPVEMVEIVEADSGQFNSFNKFNATPPADQTLSPGRVHPVPSDSILADFLDVARDFSEAPDSFAIAPILAVAGALLTPATGWNFAGRKHPNLFQFVVGPPALKKSTSFRLAETVARTILSPEHFHGGNASDSALFEKFQGNPHRLQIESEANPTISNWAGSHAGRELANRYLKLYDGDSWSQSYRHQKNGEDDSCEKFIESATLSLALGGTFGCSRFGGVDARNGLRRRFGYYVGDRPARVIYWPEGTATEIVETLAAGFRKLTEIEGTFELAPAARPVWRTIQDRNRAALAAIPGADEAAEAQRAALGEEPSRVLKLAAIFEACRWAKSGEGDPLTVRPDTLEIAAAHQTACLAAGAELDTIGRRGEIEDTAERVLSVIRGEAGKHSWPVLAGAIHVTRSELTRRFCANGDRGALTASRLHTEIMPGVIRLSRGSIETAGAKVTYLIPTE